MSSYTTIPPLRKAIGNKDVSGYEDILGMSSAQKDCIRTCLSLPQDLQGVLCESLAVYTLPGKSEGNRSSLEEVSGHVGRAGMVEPALYSGQSKRRCTLKVRMTFALV